MRSSFIRKLVYMGLALALFVVILIVRAPIETIRKAHNLTEESLGDVDPTSTTMVLVLGGLRGVAANVLWFQAQELQKEHNWYAYEPVVESIIKLQPHFIQVWTFQGWNLAYNISVEWDQVTDKYYWIKRGIKFLERGTNVNERSPELRWDVGWTYFHKIGKADEARVLRKLYSDDGQPEIDASGRLQQAFNADGLDNYQTASTWFQNAVDTLDRFRLRPRRQGEVAFRSYPAHAQTNYALAREEEGFFGEDAARQWLKSSEMWRDYADHEFEVRENLSVKLDYSGEIFVDLHTAVDMYRKSDQILQSLGAADKPLSDETKAEVESNWEVLRDITAKSADRFAPSVLQLLQNQAQDALASIRSTFQSLRNVDGKTLASDDAAGKTARQQFREFAAAAAKLGQIADEELYWCDRYATMINFRYWKERTLAESQAETVATREHFYKGMERYREGDPETARKELEQGLESWKNLLEQYPHMRDDDLTAEEAVGIVRAYLSVRQQLDLPPLKDDEIPFAHYIRRFTPQMPDPEQMEMMQRMMQQKNDPKAMEKMKREMMEKMKTPVPAQPTQPAAEGAPAASGPDKKK
jgi:hypothetical protein